MTKKNQLHNTDHSPKSKSSLHHAYGDLKNVLMIKTVKGKYGLPMQQGEEEADAEC